MKPLGDYVPLMQTILPETVVAVEVLGELAGAELLPEEVAIVKQSVSRRKQEFATARTCARKALLKLGFPPTPILQGPNREPRWPTGTVGSITHCQNYCAAAVDRRDVMGAIGIDAEVHKSLPEDVFRLVARPDERRDVSLLPCDGTFWDRLLFSAKECVFKAWFPITLQWLDFNDAKITFTPESRSFVAQVLPCGEPPRGNWSFRLKGRYLIREDLVLSAITLDAKDLIST